MCGFWMLKAMARSGVIKDWERGVSSSREGSPSSSSHLEDQFLWSSLIVVCKSEPRKTNPIQYLLFYSYLVTGVA